MILKWSVKKSFLAFLSPRLVALLRPLRPRNLVPRDLPPQGQIEEKPGNEVARAIGSYSQAYTIEIELL